MLLNGGMASVITSSALWVRSIVQLFASQGVDPAWLCAEAGLDAERLKHAHERFEFGNINRLWELAVARSGQTTLGLDRQLTRRFFHMDVPVQAMWPGGHLAGGLDALSRYLVLTADSASFQFVRERGDGWLTLDHADPAVPRQRVEFGLLVLFLICQRATRKHLRPLGVDFIYPEPADSHAHRMAFQCPLRFSQAANRMRLAREDLALPLVPVAESLFAVRERVIEERLMRFGTARTSYRASEEIIRRLHLGEPKAGDVALSLGLKEAAMEQRLRAEGASFQDLLDGVRRELAAHYFAQAGYAPRHTAALLGWDSAAELAAACKRWFGVPPAQYRQRVTADTTD
jgi:AraC-like DNA-binding protein